MNTTTTLQEQWAELKKSNPMIRIRNATEQLGVSEAELLATQVGINVTRLRPEFASILTQVESLGKVMALTRNEACVHERKGVYLHADFSNPHAGLFVGEDIDLRIFLSAWAKAYAVTEITEHGLRRSLKFFGKDGEAIHKIYLTPDSQEAAFDALVQEFTHEDQTPGETVSSLPAPAAERPDSDIDVAGFQKAWIDLKDTHDFFGMLRTYGVTRTQALRLAPNDYFAKSIAKEGIPTLLEEAARLKLPIMVFVGNRGNIQIHTGKVRKKMWHGSWYNVMDPDFNLHLDMSKVAQTWIVRKPTEDGIVTAVEVFNEQGDIIVQFFGKRKPGIPELEEWRGIVAGLGN
ncbi:MAG: hemin-degrading factor [Flavobacterium sp.]